MNNYPCKKIIPLICEGKSESAYLQEFNAYCREQGIPLVFSHVNSEGGDIKNVKKALRLLNQKCDFKSESWCWLDHDLYTRNSRNCMKKLREAQANDKRFPHIKFNYQNFEDFLSLHLDTQKAKAWSNIGETHQHQTRPMLANEYLSLFKELVPNYKKGQLPDDFDMTVALDNLKKNIILKELSQSSEMADFILQLLNSHQ